MQKRLIFALVALAALAIGVFVALRPDPSAEPPPGPSAEAPGPKRMAGPAAGEAPAPVVASGRVTDARDGKALEGALVLFTALDGVESDIPHVTRTDGSGGFRIELDPGRYAVSASAHGYQPRSIPEVAVESDTATTVDLTLVAGGNPLTGTVSDAGGGPVEGALVRLVPQSGFATNLAEQAFATLTDANGHYDLRVADGRYAARVTHEDYVRADRVFEIRGGDRTQDFSLVPAAVIEGRVVTAEGGEPVADARVQYHREASTGMPFGGGSRSVVAQGRGVVRTGTDGRFRITGLRGGLIQLVAVANGYATPEAIPVPIAVAEHVDGVELRVDPARAISGTVTAAADGAALTGIRVDARQPGVGPRGATTDERGNFRIDGLVPGQYSLSAAGDGFLPNRRGAQVAVGETDVEGVQISLDTGVAIRGRIEPAGPADVRIELVPDESGMLFADLEMLTAGGGATRAGDEGRFVLEPIRPGHYTLAARTATGGRAQLEVDVPEDGLADVVLRVEDGASVAGKVVDTHGEPVARAMVALQPHREGVSTSMIVNGRNLVGDASPTASDGTFRLTGLDAGTFAVSVTDEFGDPLVLGDGGGPMQIGLDDGEQATLDLLVEATDGVIRGQVVDAQGVPAPDSWVTVNAQPAPMAPPEPPEPGKSRRVMRQVVAVADVGDGSGGSSGRPPVLTDGEGRFEVGGLRDGKYEIVAEGMRGGARTIERNIEPGAELTIALAPLGRIEGVVRVGQTPVKDFLVQITGGLGQARRVHDEDGRFTLGRLDPSKYGLSVTSADGSGSASVTVEAGQTAEITVDVSPWSTVTGIAVGQDGTPLAHHRVALGESAGEHGFSLSLDDSDPTIETDDAGAFEVQAGAGPHVLMVLGKENPMPLVVRPFTVEPGQKLDLGTVKAMDLAQMGAQMGGPMEAKMEVDDHPGPGPGDPGSPEPG